MISPPVAAAVLVFAAALAARAALGARTAELTSRRLRASPVVTERRWPVGAPVWRRGRSAPVLSAFARATARALRSGASPLQAVTEAHAAVTGAPPAIASQLSSFVRAASDLGVSRAADAWAASSSDRAVRLVCAALSLGAASGGPLARALDGVADTLDSRTAVAEEMWAQSATARASAAVIVVAPLAFAAFATSGDTSARAFLLREPLGRSFLAVALVLQCLGGLWMARITRRSP